MPAIKAAVIETLPHLDSLSLQRYAAAAILEEIERLRYQKRYDPKAMVDWLVKLARVAEGYAKLDQGQPHDFVKIRADLERLNPDQLLALKQLALIASGGETGESESGGPATPVRRTMRNVRDLQARRKVAGTFRRREAGKVGHP